MIVNYRPMRHRSADHGYYNPEITDDAAAEIATMIEDTLSKNDYPYFLIADTSSCMMASAVMRVLRRGSTILVDKHKDLQETTDSILWTWREGKPKLFYVDDYCCTGKAITKMVAYLESVNANQKMHNWGLEDNMYHLNAYVIACGTSFCLPGADNLSFTSLLNPEASFA